MTPEKVADHFGAHRVADGQWRGKCPAHDGKSHNSLSIQAANDGKTLVKCWAGCPTDQVLNAAGLEWSHLFPPSSTSHPRHRRIDPQAALQKKAETGLRAWKEKQSSVMSARIWLRHRFVTEGERLIANGRFERGWEFLQLGYEGLSRLEWLADLLDSRQPQDWLAARKFLI